MNDKKSRYEDICFEYKLLLENNCPDISNDNDHYCNLIKLLKLDCEKWKKIKLEQIELNNQKTKKK